MKNKVINLFLEDERLRHCKMINWKSKMLVTCLAFAGLVSAMIYVFAFTGGNFKQLMFVQGTFVIWLAISIFFSNGRVKFSSYSILMWLILAVVLSSNLFINNSNYSLNNSSFAFSIAQTSIPTRWTSKDKLHPFPCYQDS